MNGKLHKRVCWYTDGKPKGNQPAYDWPHGSKPKLVYVTSHIWTVDGRLSNWVAFQVVNKDGSLREAEFGTYGGNSFKPSNQHKIVLKVIKAR